MRRVVTKSTLATLGCIVLLPLSAWASSNDQSPFSGEFKIGAGYASNPLRLPEGGESGAFVPFELRLDWEPVDSRERRFRMRFDLDGRRFGSDSLESAKRGRVRAEARYDWRLRPRGGAKHDLVLRARAQRDDRVWVSRRSGEDFELRSIDADSVSLADRYDADTYSAEFFYKRRSGPTRWEVELEAARRNYLEDYEDVAVVDSLDHERYLAKVRYRSRFLHETLELWGGAQVTWRDYDERWPRDAEGDDVLDAVQEFRDTSLRAEVRWRPWARIDRPERLEIGLEYRYGWRDDLYEGFYDRDTRDWELSIDSRLRRGVFLAFDVSTGTTEYLRYRTGNVSTNPLFTLEDLEVEARLALATRWDVTVELGGAWLDADSSNPIYRYEEWSAHVALIWDF